MATEMATGMREETARELERLRGEVLVAKEELRVRFEYYSKVLRDKHLELVAQLDEVVRVAETQMEDRQVKLNQLKVTKADVSYNLQHNELNETLLNLSRELDENILGLEASVDRIPSVWVEWCDEWLESDIVGLCRVCECVAYYRIHNLVWSGVNKGEGQMGISSPSGLSIDRDNGDIFACCDKRIQVFSKEGSYLRTITPQRMNRSNFITVSLHHLFVSCDYQDSIYKLDKVSGDILCHVRTGYLIHGLSIDADTLYVGMCDTICICHLSVQDLRSVDKTPLDSSYTTEDTWLYDLKLAPSLFIVLLYECSYPVQSFSRDGELVHLIVSQEQLICPMYFCLDRHMNILISDFRAHSVKVFNRKGQLVATIGHEGTGPGEFQNPQGIDINKEGLLVVVDRKDYHKLQFF